MRLAIEPRDGTCHIDADGCQHMLQSRLCQTDGAASPHAKGTHTLRQGAFHSSAHTVLFLPRRLVHALASLIKRLVLWTRMEIDASTLFLGLRASALGMASATVASAEAHMDAGPARIVQARRPPYGNLAFGTNHLPVLPVNFEVGVTAEFGKNRTVRIDLSG